MLRQLMQGTTSYRAQTSECASSSVHRHCDHVRPFRLARDDRFVGYRLVRVTRQGGRNECGPTIASTAILADKGLLLWCAGNHREGLALLKQLEATQPSFSSTHAYSGRIYWERKEYTKALIERRQLAGRATFLTPRRNASGSARNLSMSAIAMLRQLSKNAA